MLAQLKPELMDSLFSHPGWFAFRLIEVIQEGGSMGVEALILEGFSLLRVTESQGYGIGGDGLY